MTKSEARAIFDWYLKQPNRVIVIRRSHIGIMHDLEWRSGGVMIVDGNALTDVPLINVDLCEIFPPTDAMREFPEE